MGFHDELGLSMGSEEARSGLLEKALEDDNLYEVAENRCLGAPESHCRDSKTRQVTPGFCADLLPQTVTAGAFIRELKYSIDLSRPSSSPTRGLHPRDSLAMDISGFL